MTALAEYIKAFDKCANEPDETYETYGEVFIATEPTKKRLKQFFTTLEFSASIITKKTYRGQSPRLAGNKFPIFAIGLLFKQYSQPIINLADRFTDKADGNIGCGFGNE